MDPILILALIGAAGVFLAFTGLVMPPSVRLEKRERGWMHRLQKRLDAAELPVTAQEFVTFSLILMVILGGASMLLGAPVLAVAGVIVVPMMVWQRYEAQRDAFGEAYNESLAEVVQILREGFSATGSMRSALDHAVHNAPNPAAADFREVWSARAAGATLEEAFAPVLERRGNPYLRMVGEALTLKAKEGGNIGEVLSGLETMIREQTQLRREIAAKQSQAKLESTIVSLAPVGFFLAMKLLPWMRGYAQGFYRTLMGQAVLALALVFSVASYFMARRLATQGLTLEIKPVSGPEGLGESSTMEV